MRWVPTLAYTVALAPLLIASHAAAAGAFALYDLAPGTIQRSDWIGFAVNDAAPALAGAGCSLLLIAILVRVRLFHATARGFAVRTMPWWLLAAAIEAMVVYQRGNADFGLWSQVITWPLAALLGGLATDAIWTWRRTAMPHAA